MSSAMSDQGSFPYKVALTDYNKKIQEENPKRRKQQRQREKGESPVFDNWLSLSPVLLGELGWATGLSLNHTWKGSKPGQKS